MPHKGPPAQVSARGLFHLLGLPNGERDAALAALLASGASIKPTAPLWGKIGATTPQRIAKAKNGHKPKRSRPPQKMLASLGVLLKDADQLVHSPCWWNADYRASELAYLDRQLADWVR